MTGFKSIAISLGGNPEHARSGRRAPCSASIVAQRVGVARHLEADVEALGHAELALHVGEVALARVDGERRAHPARELEAVGVEVGDDDVARAGVADDGRRHAADRAGAR